MNKKVIEISNNYENFDYVYIQVEKKSLFELNSLLFVKNNEELIQTVLEAIASNIVNQISKRVNQELDLKINKKPVIYNVLGLEDALNHLKYDVDIEDKDIKIQCWSIREAVYEYILKYFGKYVFITFSN